MLGNDKVGDCAIAGPYHAEMLWNAMAQRPFACDTDTVLGTYAAVTGYNPDNPASDLGADPHTVAEYWQTHGLPDANGGIHTIVAAIDVEPNNVWLAAWLFGALGVCLNFPQQWMGAMDSEAPIWDALDEPNFVGGHYVLGVGRSAGNMPVVSWGQLPQITPAGLKQCAVRFLAYLSQDMFTDDVDLDGFNMDQLKSDIGLVGRVDAA
jgi:hypothetical protein